MKTTDALCAALALCIVATMPAPLLAEQSNGEQGEVRRERKAGNVRSLREIESMVLPRMSGMQYLGPEYDPASMAYRLKFIKDGKVYFVDVDARSGRIIGQSR